jgi:methylated-DNA-protein-cysteine methyltransferase-like protein
MQTFKQLVYEVVSKIPKGEVMTYGQVAAQAGKPRAARQVGFALRALGLNESQIPWWRVVNAKLQISINHGLAGDEKNLQRELLGMDGLRVVESGGALQVKLN